LVTPGEPPRPPAPFVTTGENPKLPAPPEPALVLPPSKPALGLRIAAVLLSILLIGIVAALISVLRAGR
jgi:hypothetical protein